MSISEGPEHKRYINAIILSSFAFPGAGQLMQRRLASGIIFSLLFIVPFVFFMISAVQLIVAFFKAFPDPEEVRLTYPLWVPMGKYFLMTGVVWVLSLLDIYVRHKTGNGKRKTE